MAAWNVGGVGVALLEDSRTNLDTATGGLLYCPCLVAFGVLLFYSIVLYSVPFYFILLKHLFSPRFSHGWFGWRDTRMFYGMPTCADAPEVEHARNLACFMLNLAMHRRRTMLRAYCRTSRMQMRATCARFSTR